MRILITFLCLTTLLLRCSNALPTISFSQISNSSTGSINYGGAAVSDGAVSYSVSTAGVNLSNATIGNTSRPLTSYGRISGVSTDGMTLTLSQSPSPMSSNSVVVGDEVMYHVTAATDDSDSTCGPGLYRGEYGFAQVTSTSTTNTSLTQIGINRSINSVPASINNTALNADLGGGTTFCLIQIIRVPNFTDLTLTGNAGGAAIFTTQSWNNTSGLGGILVFKVSGTLTLNSGTGLGIGAGGTGFGAGLATDDGGFPGDSTAGLSSTATISNNDNGGGGGSTQGGSVPVYAGGGGGANQSAGGSGGGNGTGGAAGMPDLYCGDSLPCNLLEKIFIGGGGGAGSGDFSLTHGGNGGAGGGIIMIFAHDIVFAGSNSILFTEAGAPGAPSSTSGAGAAGGGGGGGSILIVGQNITSQDVALSIYVAGGNGGNVSIAGATNVGGGGGGGGGNFQMSYCQFTGKDNLTVTTDGGSGGLITASSYSGNVGASGIKLLDQNSSLCGN